MKKGFKAHSRFSFGCILTVIGLLGTILGLGKNCSDLTLGIFFTTLFIGVYLIKTYKDPARRYYQWLKNYYDK